MSLKVLEEKWDEITKKVIEPLWKYKFQDMYEKAKLDEQDFMSLAGVELTKAFETYNPDESSAYTYAYNVLYKKGLSEIRNCTRREKRMALYLSESLNVPVAESSDEEIIDTIEDKSNEEYSLLSESRVGAFVNCLTNLQLKILILKLLNFKEEDISDMLATSQFRIRDALRELKCGNNTQTLKRRSFEQ